jgi:hypothetical protein
LLQKSQKLNVYFWWPRFDRRKYVIFDGQSAAAESIEGYFWWPNAATENKQF